jgi:hypothetical protein
MTRADVVFAPTSHSLSHTQARIEATRRGARIATLPTITEEIFARTLPVDYAALKRKGEWLAARLTAASAARITSPPGTEIVLGLAGRAGRSGAAERALPASRALFGVFTRWTLPFATAHVANSWLVPVSLNESIRKTFVFSLPLPSNSYERLGAPFPR